MTIKIIGLIIGILVLATGSPRGRCALPSPFPPARRIG